MRVDRSRAHLTNRGCFRPAAGVLALMLALVPSSADSQFISQSTSSRNLLEGNWQSCQEPPSGAYSERVYDHVVNGVGQFEVHLGPRREFALFQGVQDEHRDHASPENLLQPYRVPLEGTRAKHRWEIPSLNVVLHRHARWRGANRLRELVRPAGAAREDIVVASRLDCARPLPRLPSSTPNARISG